MKNTSDVIVIGGGPCGSFTAFNLAKKGVAVTVFEEHSEIGIPFHCAGHLSIKGLKQLGLHPLPSEIVENVFYGSTFYSAKGNDFSVRFDKPVTCAVNRLLFDKYVAETAEKVGAQYCLNSRVESLIVENGFTKGVNVKQNAKNESVSANIIVDAEGISSKILRLTGLSNLNRSMLVNGVEAEVDNVENTESDMVEVFLGSDYADGFYAWLIPKKDGRAKLGLATKKGNPKELLQRLMLKHPAASKKLGTAKILRMSFHPISLGGQIVKTYSNGFLAVGDVASHVKPTTGGGVIFGMNCAKIAAETACKALKENNFSSEFLSIYQKRCEEVLGFDFKVMLKIRKMLDGMSDKDVDDAICLCKKLELENILQKVEDVDFQGKSLLRLLRKPKMLRALLYFFRIYLSANP